VLQKSSFNQELKKLLIVQITLFLIALGIFIMNPDNALYGLIPYYMSLLLGLISTILVPIYVVGALKNKNKLDWVVLILWLIGFLTTFFKWLLW
jgi:hypothetical protein